jgi:hypothetical protein
MSDNPNGAFAYGKYHWAVYGDYFRQKQGWKKEEETIIIGGELCPHCNRNIMRQKEVLSLIDLAQRITVKVNYTCDDFFEIEVQREAVRETLDDLSEDMLIKASYAAGVLRLG